MSTGGWGISLDRDSVSKEFQSRIVLGKKEYLYTPCLKKTVPVLLKSNRDIPVPGCAVDAILLFVDCAGAPCGHTLCDVMAGLMAPVPTDDATALSVGHKVILCFAGTVRYTGSHISRNQQQTMVRLNPLRQKCHCQLAPAKRYQRSR